MDNAREALYYNKLQNQAVQCKLCPHQCGIKEGGRGKCRVRRNVGGMLYAENYGKVAAIAMDPIEKKPLYHFYPGKYILSIGTIGCNFSCSFCQNYHIAQNEAPTEQASPHYMLSLCRQADEECIGLAYTYNEPNVWYEYVLETAELMHKETYKNVLVSNGYISPEPLRELLPYIDAMNIDVKGFSERYYKDICGGTLKDVQRTVEISAEKAHVEVTTLVIPGYNDSVEEIRSLASWLAGINPEIPLHLTRYYPQYKMSAPPTPVETIMRLKEEAREFLDYVYVGNVYGGDSNTYCPNCNALLVRRDSIITTEHFDDGICSKCGRLIPIIGL